MTNTLLAQWLPESSISEAEVKMPGPIRRGEYFSTFLASKAWEYYMTDSTYPKMTGHFPSANEHEIAGKVGYHLREGEHLLDTFDWMCLVDHLKRQ